MWLLSPLYTAVNECTRTLNDEVENVACDAVSRVPTPRIVAPSLKVIVPVGVEPLLETAAVRTIPCPKTEGLLLETSETVVPELLTVSERMEDELALKLISSV